MSPTVLSSNIYSSTVIRFFSLDNMPSMCSFTMTCPPDTTAPFDSTNGTTRTIGISLGIIIGLVFSICVAVTVYLLFCKRKKSQIERSDQSVSMFPYAHYSLTPMQQIGSERQKVSEDAPPSYEEIHTFEQQAR